tara:strand:+ start:291 stop:692 length:402 start_codon:yes stop_codon:yes gene_type:complete
MGQVHLGRIRLPTAPEPLPPMRIEFKPPTARIPSYKPMVIPPSDLESPEGVEAEATEQPEPPKLQIPVLDIQMPIPETAVVVTAVTTAVVAVATTSVTQTLFEPIKKKVQKFLQKKIDKWKENRKKKKVSSVS